MEIGAVIRKYRLEKSLTQEDVAIRLGVTAPAVNKWEKGNSMPDIALLSPIARLFDISLDTLLSHANCISDIEANRLVELAYKRLKEESFHEVFLWAKEQLQAYPNSDFLTLYMARVLLSHVQMQMTDDTTKYEEFLISCYRRALQSENEGIKTSAADALYYYYMGNDQFEKAEEYLVYFSKENPERKRKQATIYRETGRKDEALKMYEELLYAGYQNIQSIFQDINCFLIKDKDYEKAHGMAEKMKLLAQLFEMGEYHELSPGLELAILEQDADSFFAIMQSLLDNIKSISGFTQSSLYAHMELKQPSAEYFAEVRQSILDCLEGEQCSFAKGDARFEYLISKQ